MPAPVRRDRPSATPPRPSARPDAHMRFDIVAARHERDPRHACAARRGRSRARTMRAHARLRRALLPPDPTLTAVLPAQERLLVRQSLRVWNSVRQPGLDQRADRVSRRRPAAARRTFAARLCPRWWLVAGFAAPQDER